MREAQYTAKLRDSLQPDVYALKLNLSFQNGVADAWYSGSIRDLWSEHKRFVKLPPIMDLTKHTVTTKLQQQWLIKRHGEGRNVSMVVFSPEGHMLLMGLEWMMPIYREDFRRKAVDMKQLAEQLKDYLGIIKHD